LHHIPKNQFISIVEELHTLKLIKITVEYIALNPFAWNSCLPTSNDMRSLFDDDITGGGTLLPE